MTQIPENSKECDGLKTVLGVIGDRWSVIILWRVKESPQRFVDIQKALGVNSRTLTQRLQALEEAGMIERREYKEYPPRTEYSITPKGAAVAPIYNEMMRWSKEYGE